MRDFWRSEPVGIGEFATGSAGRRTCTAPPGRRPTASVNLITVHDGFTLRDLVSYDDKHNEANGEDNRDGTTTTARGTAAPKGPTDDPDVHALRARQARAMLTTLLLSFGVPMLLGGDEIGRTQGGNNNAYCQDNEISWFDWSSADTRAAGLHQAAHRAPPGAPGVPPQALPDRRGRQPSCGGSPPAGTAMTAATGPTEAPWPGHLPGWLRRSRRGRRRASRCCDDDFLVLVNGWWEPAPFTIPKVRDVPQEWLAVLDSYDPAVTPDTVGPRAAGDRVVVRPRSITVLRASRVGLTGTSRCFTPYTR